MFYKHWKKLALSLTGFFWASCGSDVTAPNNNETPSSGNENISSSSDVNPESSSSFEMVMPAYGVFNQLVNCYEDEKGVKTNGEVSETKLYCEDGAVCKEREVLSRGEDLPCTPIDEGDLEGAVACPDYGIVFITEKTYDCDGVTYNEAEFHSRYFNAGPKPASSSSTQSSSSTDPLEGLTPCRVNGEQYSCEDGEEYTKITGDDGKAYFVNASRQMSEEQFMGKYYLLMTETVLYGSPCVFDGTCRDD